ncbi:hypothetical protein [Wolbachia pipientis]|nr:hypothetical protein [Wolbachia pipientis]
MIAAATRQQAPTAIPTAIANPRKVYLRHTAIHSRYLSIDSANE